MAGRMYQWTGAGGRSIRPVEVAEKIQEKLGDAIFTTSDEWMEQVSARFFNNPARRLRLRGIRTAGMLGMQLTRIPGSSNYFKGGNPVTAMKRE